MHRPRLDAKLPAQNTRARRVTQCKSGVYACRVVRGAYTRHCHKLYLIAAARDLMQSCLRRDYTFQRNRQLVSIA